MSPGATTDAQIVQATRNRHDRIGQSLGGVPELILGNSTDLYAGNGMFDPHAHPSQMAVVSFLARRQSRVLGLFFGCRCAFTVGA